jgi:hypothetical protein
VSEPEFTATGVRIGRRLRSLTLGGQVPIRDGRLVLLTSPGREIDSAPVEDVHTLARASRYGGGRSRRSMVRAVF